RRGCVGDSVDNRFGHATHQLTYTLQWQGGSVLQEAVMASRLSRLPSRFPVGTKFVIEGKRGGEGQVQVFSRYLEFPDGTFFPLPARPPKSPPAGRRIRRSRSSRGH
ncbi:MAG: hypothetical protein WB540_16125, partial [Pseudolabrys sp.]